MPFLGSTPAPITTSANIADGSIITDDLANGAVTAPKIAAGAIPSKVVVIKRDTTTSDVTISNAILPVTNRAGSTINVSVT